MKHRIWLTTLAWLSLCLSSAIAEDCTWNSGLWSSIPDANSEKDELTFIDGASEGAIRLDHYSENGQLIWTAEGSYICSNGAAICYLEFPLSASGGKVSQPFEIIEDGGNRYLVAAALAQSIFNADRTTTPLDGYTNYGLAVGFHNGYRPDNKNDFILPSNGYRSPVCVENDAKPSKKGRPPLPRSPSVPR